MSNRRWVSAIAVVVAAVCSTSAFAATPIRVMPLGDSITYGITPGAAMDSSPGGYRDPLYSLLTAANYNFQFVGSYGANTTQKLINNFQSPHEGHGAYPIANNPWASGNDFTSQIDNWMSNNKPDVIMLHGGTNDILINDAVPGQFYDVNTVNSRMDTLVGKIFTDKSTVKLYLAGIIPLAGGQAGKNSMVIAYNNYLKNTLVPKYKNQGRSIVYVDQYNTFTTNGVVNGTHLVDGIHPDQIGYNNMATTWANALLAPGTLAVTIPEPASLGLLFVGATLLLRRNQRAGR